jgi:hypothetical protein
VQAHAAGLTTTTHRGNIVMAQANVVALTTTRKPRKPAKAVSLQDIAALPVTAMVSAVANMCEFTAAATTTTELTIGCVMGAFVPAVAYVTNRVLAVMYDR